MTKMSNNISRICFGGASLSSEGKGYGFGEISLTDRFELLDTAFNSGIQLFDTAPIYGFGESEKVLGEFIKDKREKVHLISKSGVGWHDNGRVNMSNDPKVTKTMLEQSLRRINSDYIDTYMIHWPDKAVDIRYPLDVLSKAQDEGKIINIGLCNTNEKDLLSSKQVCNVVSIQNECNLFNSSELNQNKDLKTMGWGSFDKGILSGSVTIDRKFDSFDCRSWAPWWKKSNWKKKVQFVDNIKEKFKLNNDDMKLVSIKFSLDHVDNPIFGFSNVYQLEQVIDLVNEPCTHYKEVVSEFTLF